jgi:hypothetical protein
MLDKPLRSNSRDFFERARFFEKVRGSGDNHELFLCVQRCIRPTIERNDLVIFPADDQ